MKTKIRISVLISILFIIVFFLMYSVYNKCGFNYRPAFGHPILYEETVKPVDGHPILYEETVKPVDEVAAFKENLWQENAKFIPGRKRRKVKISPVVYGDSNQAAEVIDDDENKSFLNVSFPTKDLVSIPTSSSFLRSKLVKDCLKMERKHLSKENRQEFADLVSLSRQMQASPLFNFGARQPRITIQKLHTDQSGANLRGFMKRFQNKISNHDLYEENDPDVDAVLEGMATMKIKKVEEISKGTQLKLIVTFKDGSKALLKPMRFDRERETNPNHFYFNDFERHNSEIAAFHLDRILGFRGCPPVVGRRISIKMELFDNADKEFKKTFYISPAENICFHGHCKQYCDSSHAICGQPSTVEVSLAAFLTPERNKSTNPWKRTYNKRNTVAEWEKNDSYCKGVRKQSPYNNSKHLANFMDMIILDFLIGNMDRHSYETIEQFGNDSFILHLDQGRGFGRANYDELSILAPLKQCCLLNPKTFYRLIELQHHDLNLSILMRCSLLKDPLNPVLTSNHLEALDRRLEIILYTVRECIRKHGMNNVFYR